MQGTGRGGSSRRCVLNAAAYESPQPIRYLRFQGNEMEVSVPLARSALPLGELSDAEMQELLDEAKRRAHRGGG